jgi:hypothetical protein
MILQLTADALRDLAEYALFVAASDHLAARIQFSSPRARR